MKIHKPQQITYAGIIYFLYLFLFSGINITANDSLQLMFNQGHFGFINTVTFSPDGKLLASGSSDNTIKVWDAGNRKELFTLAGHTGKVYSVVFSPDGMLLASSSEDKTVRVWDIKYKREIFTLRGYKGSVNALAFSPGGDMLASGSSDNKVIVWDFANQEVLYSFTSNTNGVYSVAFSPDGKLLAGSGWDKTLSLWEMAHPEEPALLTGNSHWIGPVVFSPDGKMLASGFADKSVRVWDVEGRKELFTLNGHSNWIGSVAFGPDGKLLASAGWDKTIKVWDIKIRQELYTLTGHMYEVTSVVFSPDGKWLASGSSDLTIRIWDTEKRKELCILSSPYSKLSIASNNSGYLISPGNSKDFYLVKGLSLYEFPVTAADPVELYRVNEDYLLRRSKNPHLEQPLNSILENKREISEIPYMETELTFQADPFPMAGKPLFITVKIANKGKDFLFQTKATLSCDQDSLFNNLVFNLGEIEPGGESYCIKAVDIPWDWQPRSLPVDCLFEEAHEYKAEPVHSELLIAGKPEPQLVYTWSAGEDVGNGNGKIEPGEGFLLKLELTNQGIIDADYITIRLRLSDPGNNPGFFSKPVSLDHLKKGEQVNIELTGGLTADFRETSIDMILEILYEDNKHLASEVIRLDPDKTPPAGFASLNKQILLEKNTRIYTELAGTSPVMRVVSAEAPARAVGKLADWIKVEFGRGFTGFIKEGTYRDIPKQKANSELPREAAFAITGVPVIDILEPYAPDGLEYRTDRRSTAVKFQVSDDQSTPLNIRIRLNNTLINGETQDQSGLLSITSEGDGKKTIYELGGLLLEPGMNRLAIEAVDANNRAGISELMINWRPQQNTLYGFIAGVSLPEMAYAAKTGEEFLSILEKQVPGIKADIFLNTGFTKDSLLNWAEDNKHNIKEEDTVLIYYSGPGVISNAAYYMLSPASQPDRLTTTAMEVDALNKAIMLLQARQFLIIINSSFSGSALSLIKTVKDKNIVVITACGADEEVLADNTGGSYFFGYLKEALTAGRADTDKSSTLSVKEIYEYIAGKFADNKINQSPHALGLEKAWYEF